MDERLFWLGFSLFPGIGPVRFQKLLAHFGSAKDAWRANLLDLEKAKIGNAIAQSFVAFRETCSMSDYQERLCKEQVEFVTLNDRRYPKRLAKSKRAPFVLYLRGEFDFNAPENQQAVAIVGARRMTQYGEQVTKLFTRDLVAAGCVIVSGLAMGVDATAHTATIASNGRTVAVLGCGVDCCTPKENTSLYNSIIAEGGVVVAEFPLGMEASKGSFPSRNRIIAGLSLGVVVTEGTEDSGSLITAKDAFENDRQVFAVPGPITSNLSKGPFALIGKGAKLVTSAREVLESLEIPAKAQMRKGANVMKGGSQEEQMIIDLLENESMHFDDLVRRVQVDSGEMGTILSLLEMKGVVKNLGSGIFCLTSS